MSIQKFLTSSIENDRYQQYSLELHQRRLKEINEKSPKVTQGIIYKLKKRNKFSKEREVDKQNMKLLSKLIKIAKNKEKFDTRSLTPKPKTLNSIIRKKEAFRVAEENKKIADRIATRSPVLSLKIFEKEYGIQNRYKEMLMKYSPLSIRKNGYFKRFDISEKIIRRIPETKESGEISAKDENCCTEDLVYENKV
ncbi:hypothetical protein SteCoe_3866 [Stentor coeruleus]|uniref:Uncharacterized protein n=1 Tax=Stentor coeruleus TaxID=5963 RepID=A0A1R2CW14_9CILI|nr:hypothetical protein SteCoe_3866 [Stentor coeruleus]